jgi:hypothetical protein
MKFWYINYFSITVTNTDIQIFLQEVLTFFNQKKSVTFHTCHIKNKILLEIDEMHINA